MTSPPTVVTGLPMTRPAGCPFDPPRELARLREQRPISRMLFPDGHVGRLVTGYELTRAILADPRFSSRHELMHNPFPGPVIPEIPPAPPGMFIGIDPPEHTRYRKLLAGKFTARRMRLLTERVQHITEEQLDAMERHGPPVDLVTAFALPIPTLMICELLGVPYAQRDSFQHHAIAVSDNDAPPEERYAAMIALGEYLQQLVQAKRAEPTDDLLSDLTTGDLTDEELTNIGSLLLGAGLDTSANMIALGAFALLQHPAQLSALRNDPSLADQAVEELLRYLSIAHTMTRTALEDVELDGHTVKAGETLAISIQAGNRDPATYTDPDLLDLRRNASGHLAFGHGMHLCLGHQLARVELRVAYPALATRFPTLRLTIPTEDAPMRTNSDIYGVHRLPVTWDSGT